ncbi:MAG: twin-arginine translocase subunit TatC [Prevotella sp.]|nr:twin-arginine translocase subunit TatC [Prevotella sp.]
MSENSGQATFWDHLDELRMRLIKIVIVVSFLTIIAFLLKELLFDVILAPKDSQFVTYRILNIPNFSIQLINTGLSEQFMVHMRTALYVGVLAASPYIIYELFRFVLPGLYTHERRYAYYIGVTSYLMFLIGILLNYFLIFPLTVRFLGTYQVSSDVTNMLSIQSYIDTLISMSFMMGVLFELPVVCWLLGRLGIINKSLMSTYRRHAIVVILVLAAIVTPTTDVFTLFVVSLPIWVLYELSVLIVKS